MTDSAPAPALTIGPIPVAVPVVLAPMAGITNTAYRRLCREAGEGLFVSEMITSRALVERTPESLRLITHHESESTRSIQLYGVDPVTVAEAVTFLVAENRADHIDLNFGCPVPKVTRKGGGAALPWKRTLFRRIVEAAAAAAGDVPLTVKMRMGIDDDHLTYLEAAKAAEGAGAAAVALHARTAQQHYSGQARWDAIGTLKSQISSIPVLGNGDIWSAGDALRMVEQTGCDGVVVGRGCLGRPWLFADLTAAFQARAAGASVAQATAAVIQPSLGGVADTLLRHAQLLTEFFDDGEGYGAGYRAGKAKVRVSAEDRACRDIRKHIAWYFKGYPLGSDTRRSLALVESLAQLEDLLGQLDRDQPYPGVGAEGQRGRAGAPKRTVLPEGWLDSQEMSEAEGCRLTETEADTTGG